MHPHANTHAHPAYTCDRAYSSPMYTDFPQVPTDRHAWIFVLTHMHTHTWTHSLPHSTMFIMPVHRHAPTEHQICDASPVSTVLTEARFFLPEHRVTADCPGNNT